MTAIVSLNTAVFYCCDQCNRLIPPPNTTAIKTQIMGGNRYRFSWKNRSVTWKKECGAFRVSFHLDGNVEVLKEGDFPRKHTCNPLKPVPVKKEMADSKQSDRPEYIDEILRSIRERDEDCLRALCEKNLNIHEFRDCQGRSIFHLIAAECFNTSPANRFERQGKINLLVYLCAEHDPSTYKDAQGKTPLEWAKAYPNKEATDAFTEVDYWRPTS